MFGIEFRIFFSGQCVWNVACLTPIWGILFVITTELFPTHSRATGLGLMLSTRVVQGLLEIFVPPPSGRRIQSSRSLGGLLCGGHNLGLRRDLGFAMQYRAIDNSIVPQTCTGCLVNRRIVALRLELDF